MLLRFLNIVGPATVCFMPLLILASVLKWIKRRQTPPDPEALLCPGCGYDLRATPGRCPECGEVVPQF